MIKIICVFLSQEVEQANIVKNPGPKDKALICPWKGLFYLKPYKLKVPKASEVNYYSVSPGRAGELWPGPEDQVFQGKIKYSDKGLYSAKPKGFLSRGIYMCHLQARLPCDSSGQDNSS